MGGISITQLLIIAVIVVLLFGTKNCARWVPISAPRSRASKKRSVTIRRRPPTRLKKAAWMTLISRPSLLPISSRK